MLSRDSNPKPVANLVSLLLALFCLACSKAPGPAPQRSASNESPPPCLGDQRQAFKPRRVAVVPQLPPSEIYARWGPLLQELGLRSRLCFDLMVPSSIPAFERLLENGALDYAFMNPYHQVMVKRVYRPLVRDDQRPLKGVLVAHRHSKLNKLEDLRGQTVSFPSANAFAASLLIRADLRQRGIPIKADYVKSHSNVYRSVALKLSSAGGGVNNTLKREDPDVARHLKVLYATRGYAAHPFSANVRLPRAETIAVERAWLSLSQDPDQKTLLNRVQIPQPVSSNFQRDYAPLETLGLADLVMRGAP